MIIPDAGSSDSSIQPTTAAQTYQYPTQTPSGSVSAVPQNAAETFVQSPYFPWVSGGLIGLVLGALLAK